MKEALTKREREILALIVADRPTKAIAHDLSISIKTVEGHRESINRKLGTCSPISTVLAALHHGLVFVKGVNA